MEENYLKSARTQFEYYKVLGERTLDQLSDEALFWQHNEASNSIAVIVKHLWGNMRSRWTDFLHSDGEKDFRDRDAEFEADIKDRKELMEKWEEGWNCVFAAMDTVDAENIHTTVYIRNMGHSVVEAVNRQLCHYAYHIGQLVYLGRMMKGEDWKSLSIPKGQSKAYNARKFSQPRRQEHFTKEYLKDKGEKE